MLLLCTAKSGHYEDITQGAAKDATVKLTKSQARTHALNLAHRMYTQSLCDHAVWQEGETPDSGKATKKQVKEWASFIEAVGQAKFTSIQNASQQMATVSFVPRDPFWTWASQTVTKNASANMHMRPKENHSLRFVFQDDALSGMLADSGLLLGGGAGGGGGAGAGACIRGAGETVDGWLERWWWKRVGRGYCAPQVRGSAS